MKPAKTTSQWGKDKASERYRTPNTGSLETSPEANAHQKPQNIQDKQDKGYENDAEGWVRGMGPKSPYPTFDKHKSG